ncbi:MAG: acyltransferase family protein [Chloroflexia bacterium]
MGKGEPRLKYLPGLDGLRALAVIAVILYHAELPWIPGGFLGVEIFFALSGYLITSLLLAEYHQHGKINLGAFWLRRARRLLPALFLLILVTLTFAVLFLPDEVARLRGESLAAGGYVTNWYLIFKQEPYFVVMGRPSLLQHLWSLAVEEQFYLVWPLVVTGGLLLFRNRFRIGILVSVLAVSAMVTLLMALLYQPDADPSRLYYGTDMRAPALLLGCALALVLSNSQGRVQDSRLRRVAMGLIGLGGLIVLSWIVLTLDENQPFLYQGGFAVTSLATVAVIAGIAGSPGGIVSSMLGWPLLRWIGSRSYGLYLWHWPVFAVTRPGLDVPLGGAPLLALRLAATVLLAEISYRLVETPIRRGALGRGWGRFRESTGRQRRGLALRWAGSAVAGVGFLMALSVAVAGARDLQAPSYLQIEDQGSQGSSVVAPTPLGVTVSSKVSGLSAQLPRANIELETMPPGEGGGQDLAPGAGGAKPTQEAPAGEHESVTPTPEGGGSIAVVTPQPAEPTAPPAEVDNATTALLTTNPVQNSAQQETGPQKLESEEASASKVVAQPAVHRITAIGDSVMLGAANALKKAIPNIALDAGKSRQVSAGITLLRTYAKDGMLGDIVVVHLGANGTFTSKQFDQLMQVAGSNRTVVFLNNKVPRRWEGSNNKVIADGVERYPNAILLDWHSVSVSQAGLLYKDGIHLTPAGIRVYTSLISSAIEP